MAESNVGLMLQSARRTNQIEQLLKRRFPWKGKAHGTGGPYLFPHKIDEAIAYEAELNALSLDELASRVAAAEDEDKAAAVVRKAAEEQTRPFNRPEAVADADYWSRLTFWSTDEAVALSFGRDPSKVAWDKVAPFAQLSPFAVQYARLREIVRRAVLAKQLTEPVWPGQFIAWTDRLEIAFSSDVRAAVIARGVHIGDFQTLQDQTDAITEQAQLQVREAQMNTENALAALEALKAAAADRTDFLTGRIVELEQQLAGMATAVDDLGARERDSLLKLVIGMAVKGYGYDPTAKRSTCAPEIASDLAALGLAISDDTVRKFLKEARDLLPPAQDL